MSYGLKLEGETVMRFKQYDKFSELIQKGTVGKPIGTRIGSIVGKSSMQPEQVDNAWNKRIHSTMMTGMFRKELSVYRNSGYLTKLDGRPFDFDHAKTFVRTL